MRRATQSRLRPGNGVGQRRHRNGVAVGVQRDHHEVPAGAELALAGVQVFGDQLHFHLHRAAAHFDNATDGFHHLADADRQLEIDLVRTRGDHGAARVAGRGEEGRLVHPGQRLATEQGAEVVGVVGEDDLGHADFSGRDGVWGGGHGGGRLGCGAMLRQRREDGVDGAAGILRCPSPALPMTEAEARSATIDRQSRLLDGANRAVRRLAMPVTPATSGEPSANPGITATSTATAIARCLPKRIFGSA